MGKQATLETSLGTIVFKLFANQAPETVTNFIGLATGTKEWRDPMTGAAKAGKPLYDGTIFHRVIPNFMIQGGDPLGTGSGGPGYRFKDEFGTINFDRPGLVAMANAGPNTNGSQFFITDAATPHLNRKHTIFGEVTSGLDIVQNIARVKTVAPNRPVVPVVIKSVTISDETPIEAAPTPGVPPNA